jgi:uncharacterized caspase-like protein
MSGYRHAPALKNPANDAKDMSTALRELGFTVTEAADLDKRALDEAVRTFAHRIAGADAALVFFGGHGLQVAGQNYLLPIDAKLESERDLDFETVRLEFILRQMESGRNGKVQHRHARRLPRQPAGAQSRALHGGALGRLPARPGSAVQSGAGMFVAFSTQPATLAYDGQGRNSPLRGGAAAQYPHGRQGLNALMIDVRKDVMAATGGRQVPWEHSALTEDFRFRSPAEITTGSVPSSAPLSAEDARREERTRRLDEELGRPRRRLMAAKPTSWPTARWPSPAADVPQSPRPLWTGARAGRPSAFARPGDRQRDRGW